MFNKYEKKHTQYLWTFNDIQSEGSWKVSITRYCINEIGIYRQFQEDGQSTETYRNERWLTAKVLDSSYHLAWNFSRLPWCLISICKGWTCPNARGVSFGRPWGVLRTRRAALQRIVSKWDAWPSIGCSKLLLQCCKFHHMRNYSRCPENLVIRAIVAPREQDGTRLATFSSRPRYPKLDKSLLTLVTTSFQTSISSAVGGRLDVHPPATQRYRKAMESYY